MIEPFFMFIKGMTNFIPYFAIKTMFESVVFDAILAF